MTSLGQRMVEDMQVRNLALNTQRSYLEQVSRFARHFSKSPELLGPEQIRAYQVYLTTEKKLAPGSIIIAVAALRFLYKVTLKKTWLLQDIIPAPKKPQTLPVVLSPEEVAVFDPSNFDSKLSHALCRRAPATRANRGEMPWQSGNVLDARIKALLRAGNPCLFRSGLHKMILPIRAKSAKISRTR